MKQYDMDASIVSKPMISHKARSKRIYIIHFTSLISIISKHFSQSSNHKISYSIPNIMAISHQDLLTEASNAEVRKKLRCSTNTSFYFLSWK